MTLFGALGGVIARGGDPRDVFSLVRPGIDLANERRRRTNAGRRLDVTVDDLYPDALPCVRSLIASGYLVGIAGNQPTSTEAVLRGLDVPLALVASSERWHVHKPDPAFFSRIAGELQLAPGDVAYVGDRVDNDVRPAAAAGMRTVFIRRGPWAFIQAGRSDPMEADATIEALDELPAALRRLESPIPATG